MPCLIPAARASSPVAAGEASSIPPPPCLHPGRWRRGGARPPWPSFADGSPHPPGRRRTRRGPRASRPRPALRRRGRGRAIEAAARASATAAASASLSRASDGISHRPRPHTPCPPRRSRRGPAHSPRGRAARPSPAARGSGRSAAAAPNAPGSQCFRSHTTTAANGAIYDRRAPPRGRIAQTQQTCSAPPAAAAAPFRPRIGGDVGPIRPSTILRARALPCRARRAAGPIGAVCCLGSVDR